jgi:hypothetical protein
MDGKAKAYHAGDWVDVGKQVALRWLADGSARVLEPITIDLPPGSGIQVWRGESAGVKAGGITIAAGERRLAFDRTLLYDSSLGVRLDLLNAGFGFLDSWQMAVPLHSYEVLAEHAGTAEDRERTAAVIPTLKIPMYDTRLIFMRRCPECEEVLRLWGQDTGEERLALLRAIYRVKPLILALPVTWLEDGMKDKLNGPVRRGP